MSELRPQITIGSRIGMLTVESKTDQKRHGYIVWRCRCDCGGEILLDTRYLQRGTVTSCGCRKTVKLGTIDLTGQRFGRLVALEPTEARKDSGSVVWRCQCDCGNICYVSLHQLRMGYTKSCGCLSHPGLKELVGKRFGMLTVTDYAGKHSGMHRWRCRCDCGRETVVGQSLLQSGKTKSCGCLQATHVIDTMGFVEGTSVAALQARMNRPPIATNTSGYNGVYLNKKTGKWIAQITFKGKTYHLGSFADIQDAVRARKRGEEMYKDFLDWYNDEYLPEKKRKEMSETG